MKKEDTWCQPQVPIHVHIRIWTWVHRQHTHITQVYLCKGRRIGLFSCHYYFSFISLYTSSKTTFTWLLSFASFFPFPLFPCAVVYVLWSLFKKKIVTFQNQCLLHFPCFFFPNRGSITPWWVFENSIGPTLIFFSIPPGLCCHLVFVLSYHLGFKTVRGRNRYWMFFLRGGKTSFFWEKMF